MKYTYLCASRTSFPCSSEGGVEQCDSCELRPAPPCARAAQHHLFSLFFNFHSYSGFRTPRRIAAAEFKETVDGYFKEDKRQPLSLSSCSIACLVRQSCLIKVAASSSLSVITRHSAGFPVLQRCVDSVQQGKVGLLTGRLASRPRGRSVGQPAAGGNIEASLSSCASQVSSRRDNGEDSDAQHGEANKPNTGQALRYHTKASAAAALPEAEGKKTTDTTREKSLRVRTILFV